MLSLGFNLERTALESDLKISQGFFYGKRMVFTGKMNHGTRQEMQALARKYGAVVQSSISGNTQYLVCGEKAGQSKIAKAKKSGARVIMENEYFDMLKGPEKKALV
ncbi:MAG: hypothetical protein HKO79_10705 [Desulfobacterales bacterium]|nr:hypothetical protein [Desulfobacterales bacterium]